MSTTSRPTQRRARRPRLVLVAAAAVAAGLVVSACVPPATPPSPPTPTAVTTTVAPPTTCRAATSGGQAASLGVANADGAAASGTSAALDSTAAPLDSTSAVVAAAHEAVADAIRTGAGEVTVVAVDGDGRPAFVDAPLAAAADVAVATAASLDVVAVEAPAPFTAAETAAASTTSATDPLLDQQWALAKFSFASLWPCGRGNGITVAVVDSGVTASHQDFGGRVTPGVSFLNGSAPQPGGGTTDAHGHGTHVAGIIAAGENGIGIVGVAPAVTIVPVRVLDGAGVGASSDIARGITWAVDEGVDVINASLGSDQDTAAVSAAVAYAVDHGIPVVAAAGNGGPNGTPRYPAALPAVIAVAALNPDRSIANYSTRGDYVDVAAPGTDIYSTWSDGGWKENSGTSMAAPHVSALVALIIAARGPLPPAALATRLASTATDAGPPGFDRAYGWGRIDPIAAFNAP